MSTTYLFTVSGEKAHLVVEWDIGDVDPGKEYLRVATGGLYSGCSISDYDPVLDLALPREHHGYENGVITGVYGVLGNVPGLGPIIISIGKIFSTATPDIPDIPPCFVPSKLPQLPPLPDLPDFHF